MNKGFEGVGSFVSSINKGFAPMGDFVSKQTQVPDEDSLGLVRAYATYLDSVKEESRAAGFHVSGLYRFCPIQWCLNQIIKKERKIPYRLRFRFDIGHALHSMLQNHFGGMGILKGQWKCSNGHVTEEICLRPEKCGNAKCKSNHFSYKEIGLSDPDSGIIGKTDGVLLFKGEHLGLEIKTIDAPTLSMFHSAPEFASFQMNVYAHLLRQSLFPDLKRGVILLTSLSSKDSILLPVKTFVVEYTDGPWNDSLRRVQLAKSLLDQYKSKKLSVADLISHRVCATASEGRKSDCMVCDECFSTSNLTKIMSGGEKCEGTVPAQGSPTTDCPKTGETN